MIINDRDLLCLDSFKLVKLTIMLKRTLITTNLGLPYFNSFLTAKKVINLLLLNDYGSSFVALYSIN